MKKRILKLICFLILICILFSGCASELNLGSAEIKFKKQGSQAVVTELPNSTNIKVIKIPDEYDGLPVTEIADFAGCNLESAEIIEIGRNVKTIGVWAFANNQSLKEFKVSEENEYFCSSDGVLFTKDMKNLLSYPAARGNEYTVPNSVEVLRSKSFYKCSALEKLTLSQNLKSIEEKTFFRCSAIKSLVLPETLEAIGKDAFGYCTEITEITVPKSVKQIDEYAFYNCNKLLTVTMQGREDSIKLGKNWYPTDNGLNIDKLNIIWEQEK